MVPALVITGHLSLVRSLGRRGVPVISVQYSHADTGHLSRYSSGRLEVPSPLDDEGGFVEALLAAGERYPGAVLIPMFDGPLMACSKHKVALSEYYLVAASDWETTRIYLEKSRTFELATSLGIPLPLTSAVDSFESAKETTGRLRPPYLVKPVLTHQFQSRFGSKMIPADTSHELENALRRCLDEGMPVMVQEFIPGGPANGAVYAGYFDEGECLAETTHGKVRDGPPVYGSPRVAISKHIPEIIEPSRRLMEATAFTGFACVEFKRDHRDGVFKLMEVNARHNLAGALHVKSGVDYPWIQYEHLVYGRRPDPVTARDGIYWIDVFRDIGYTMRGWRSEGLTFGEFIKPYVHSAAFRRFDWRDPLPFLAFPLRRIWNRVAGF